MQGPGDEWAEAKAQSDAEGRKEGKEARNKFLPHVDHQLAPTASAITMMRIIIMSANNVCEQKKVREKCLNEKCSISSQAAGLGRRDSSEGMSTKIETYDDSHYCIFCQKLLQHLPLHFLFPVSIVWLFLLWLLLCCVAQSILFSSLGTHSHSAQWVAARCDPSKKAKALKESLCKMTPLLLSAHTVRTSYKSFCYLLILYRYSSVVYINIMFACLSLYDFVSC